jgi:aminoglycoside phosphotransferase family enzyme
MLADSPDAQTPYGQPPLIKALLRPEAYPHPVESVQLVETHISWVLLTGLWAYKIKKPIDLGFVQAATFEQRLHYCREELRLNQRLAPDLYAAVDSVVGPAESARILACDPDQARRNQQDLLEATVRMHQFPSRSLLSNCLNEPLPDSCFEELADSLAQFHHQAARATSTGPLGTASAVIEPVQTNLLVLDQRTPKGPIHAALARHRTWTEQESKRLSPRFQQRLEAGAIRECHGDLHCGNIHRRADGKLEVFDAIDFNPGLRWIDPISEIAFLVMDLQVQQQSGAGAILLNRWLECSGDYRAMDLWRWYFAYRAMVRAKVTAVRQGQQPNATLMGRVSDYIERAAQMEQPAKGGLVLMHGLSGSGKSTLSRFLVGALPALRVRSDLERARAFGRLPLQVGWRTDPDPYSAEVTAWLFEQRLPELVESLLSSGSGFDVIVDATFLRRREREWMRLLAKRMDRAMVILHCQCSDATASTRIQQRQALGRDPSEADCSVRERQKQWLEPLDLQEQAQSVVFQEGDRPSNLLPVLRSKLLGEPVAGDASE